MAGRSFVEISKEQNLRNFHNFTQRGQWSKPVWMDSVNKKVAQKNKSNQKMAQEDVDDIAQLVVLINLSLKAFKNYLSGQVLE